MRAACWPAMCTRRALQLLVDKFLEPTKRLGNDVVPADKVNRIFGNVAAIANFHEILLNVLRQQRDKAPDNAEAMAAAFVAYADCMWRSADGSV